MSDKTILERAVFHAGKRIIIQGETNSDSYIIQQGEIAVKIIENNNTLELKRYYSGDLIAENNLLFDDPSAVTLEAVKDTTVIKITRQDFEKKLSRVDSTLFMVVSHLIKKMHAMNEQMIANDLEAKRMDAKAMEIVDHLLRDMDGSKRKKYEDILMPHFNVMVKAIETIRKEERRAKQKEKLDQKLKEIQDSED